MDIGGAVDGSPVIPEVGDITICTNCGAILQFDCYMKLHKLTFAEHEQFLEQAPKIYKKAFAVSMAVKMSGGKNRES